MVGKRSGLTSILSACVLLLCAALASGDPINAVFELRKAASDPDTILNPGETLHLEVYLTLSSTGSIPNLQAVSWFLQLDQDENDVLLFNNDFIDDTGLSHILVNRVDNEPVQGTLARASYQPGGVFFPNGQAQRIGRFSVTALDSGPVSRSVTYAFAHSPPQRPWVVDVVGQGETVNLSALAGPTIQVLPPVACASITQWRSVRTHGTDGDLAIVLNPTASGNGISGPKVESRLDGIRKIEVDFSCSVSLADPSGVSVTGRTTINGSLGPLTPYTPSSVVMVSAGTMAILFDSGVLPNESCYTISMGPGTLNQPLWGDTDVAVRILTGDTIGDGDITISDVLATKWRVSPPQLALSNPQYDINLSGGYITVADVLLVKSRVVSPSMKAVCP